MTEIKLANGWTLKPVIVDDAVQLWDIFDPEGHWRGSRRTVKMAREETPKPHFR